MNSGSIANRYAEALMAYVNANGTADAVSEQVSVLLATMKHLPDFRLAITDNHALNLKDKLSLCDTLFADKGNLHPDLVRLLSVMYQNGRLELVRLALLDFLYMYREQKGILHVRVTLPDEGSKVPAMLEEMVRVDFNKQAVISTRIDSDIIGGFIVEGSMYRLDASVRTQLERSLRQFSRNYKKQV